MLLPNTAKTGEKGFTLIEIVVVVVILTIAYAAIINLLNIDRYLRQARDAKRLNDMLTMQTAILNALATKSIKLMDTSSCTTCNSFEGTDETNGSGWIRFENTLGKGLTDFITNLPIDPKNDGNFKYEFYANDTGFEINVQMESEKYSVYALQDGGSSSEKYERGTQLDIK